MELDLHILLSGMKIPKHFMGKYYPAKWLGNPSQKIKLCKLEKKSDCLKIGFIPEEFKQAMI